MRKSLIVALLIVPFLASPAKADDAPKLLVYTRNYTPDGKGYVHENITTSVQALKEIGGDLGFEVDASDDPAVFSPENLARYRAIVFSNSNNEAFSTDDQRAAFEGFLKRGGGLVGIHSASGSERNWPFFWSVMGGKFRRHPKLQKFTVRVVDANHPATANLPPTFEWEDECYLHEFLNPDIHPLLVTDPTKLDDPKFPKDPGSLVGDAVPLAWRLEAGGGRTFYTSMGHKSEHYANPILREILKGGIQWATEHVKP